MEVGEDEDRMIGGEGATDEGPAVNSSDGSADSMWEPDSDDAADTADENAAPSGGEESDDDESWDTGIISIDDDLRAKVTRLIQEDPCEKRCLEGKADQLEKFLCSLSQMTAGE
ncbi:hypothetical protein BBJ28_00024605 [Nothophytophthora sp. Chile5]|nr:hypothetical protein BBJ28_00024605 [Nothophytophthora sp. Chile5]